MAAAKFAAERHCWQRRKGPGDEPYINHLIEVAQVLSSFLPELDAELVMAGLLHDTVEDVGVTVSELEDHFGPVVTGLVLEVTDDKHLVKADRKRLQVENAPRKSTRAQALGAADKICNLRSLLYRPPADWTFERKREYFDWAKQVVDGYPSLNGALRAEFERVYAQFNDFVKP